MNQRRLSDISFLIDSELNVKDANRSFLRLVQKTDFNLNISYMLEESDTRNLKFFLSNFDDKLTKHSFLANIKPFENSISCIFTITKENGLFRVVIEELSYSRQLLNKALLESREFTALLQNFDAYYFTYDGKKYILKNTKDLITVFDGQKAAFKEYLIHTFKINLHNADTAAQLDSMFANIEEFKSNKYYNFLQTDKKIFTIHTLKTSTRDNSLIVGSISLHKAKEPLMNTHSESRDGLTGLYNKKAITEMAIKKINEEKTPCTLIILDADKFKECNDSYGHIFGDRVLVTIASCITDAIKGKGVAGRIGGDEFLIILDLVEEDDIRNVTRNIRTGIQWNITNVEPGSIVTCSMGIARFPLHAQNYNDLFELADKSLYIAKYRGRNCYIIYKPEIHDKIIVENKQVDNRVSSGKFFADSVDSELQILNELDNLNKDDSKSVLKVLNLVCSYLQISKITVYDKNLKLKYIAGKDKNDIRKDYLAEGADYFHFFNEYNFLHLDNTNILSSVDGKFYEMYRNSDISTTLEALFKTKSGKPKMLICYDLYKPARSFKKDKITFALLIARKLSEIL
ncbi:GGDEF domain-containing protein [Treponema sp.]|uniref:GGDEF domain-containing protein n=1 Tax=Treponema sp. TaxID=166 RepID=UPI00388D9BB7